MNSKIAVYVNDYMTLLELASKIDAGYPQVELMVFGSQKLSSEFKDKSLEYELTDISKLREADVLIMLAKPEENAEEYARFDGTVVDAIGYTFADDAEVIKAANPILEIFENIDRAPAALTATVWLPVCIFGQAGVEDLMSQTKDIFTFQSSENTVIEDRIAFNVHFEPEYINQASVSDTFIALRKQGLDVSVRLLPLSTVFMVDVFSDDDFELHDIDNYVTPNGYYNAESLPDGKLMATKRRNGYSFTGDYLRVYVDNILKQLEEVI